MMWNAIEPHPFRKGAAYITGTRYKSDDFAPYIYRTEDYGKTWTAITSGIDRLHFTRVVRADRRRPGLLYAGTEYGMYISFDDGARWKPFQQNLPVVPITDITVKNNDLIVATQGRAFWVIDDLSMVQQADAAILSKGLHVYDVNPAYRMPIVNSRYAEFMPKPVNAGSNPTRGVTVNFFVARADDSTRASVTVFDPKGREVRTYSTRSKENRLELAPGLNRFSWDLSYPASDRAEGMILWNGTPSGILAPPGVYSVRIRVGRDSVDKPFTVLADPNYKVSQADYDAQFAFLRQVQDKFDEVQKTVRDIRALRTQLTDFVSRQGADCPAEVKAMADSIGKRITALEEKLHQTKAKSGQDVLNYPIRLNDKLGGVFDMANSGYMAPSRQAREVFADLSAQADVELARWKKVLNEEVPAFNRLVREQSLPVIRLK
jgi:hypothetical protein